MGKWAIGVSLLAVAFGLSTTQKAQAATAVQGTCGMHLGALVRRNQLGSQYNFRVGPKYNNASSPNRCHGYARVFLKGKTGGTLGWYHYSTGGWNYHTVILLKDGVVTGVGCTATGQAIVGIISAVAAGATDGLAYPAVVAGAGAVGCADGAHSLWSLLPNGPSTISGVRIVK